MAPAVRKIGEGEAGASEGAVMKILFITSNRIGDAVLSTGLLNHLIKKYPESKITVGCGPEAAPLFSETPNVTRVLVLAKRRMRGHWRTLWRQVAGTRWDLIVDLRASAIAWFVMAKKRRVYRPGRSMAHRVEHLSEFFRLDEVAPPGLWFGQPQVSAARHAIPAGGLVLGIGPTANWAGKQWASAKFAELVGRLTGPGAAFESAWVAVFGAASEREAAQPMLDRIPRQRRIDAVGRFDILTAAACLQECDFYIGNDSGLMHLAAATGTPTLGLFGPSRDEMYAPWGPHCAAVRTLASYETLAAAPGFHPDRRDSLMDSLSVEAAEEAAVALWENARPADMAPLSAAR